MCGGALGYGALVVLGTVEVVVFVWQVSVSGMGGGNNTVFLLTSS